MKSTISKTEDPDMKVLFSACAIRLRALAGGIAQVFTREYWFAPGCKRSYQICRCIFAILYLYLAYVWIGYPPRADIDGWVSTLNSDMYRPLGILTLFGNTPPGPEIYKACIFLLLVCPITLLLGFCSRISLLGCSCGLFGLAILEYGYALEWSHGFSPILVSSLAFLLGPRHDSGFDGWLRRQTGTSWTTGDDRRARAAVVSVQLLISLVFLNAACYKFYARGEGLESWLPWVFSDNLRNVIIRQHVLFDVPIEQPFRFIVSHAFAYKAMALGNMLAQTLPFVAFFLLRHPWLRFFCGLALGMEVIGLGFVMGIWNCHWLLFIGFFVDWDRLFARSLTSSCARITGEARLQTAVWPQRMHIFLLVLLLSFNGYVMAAHTTQRGWTFPFTSYPMFSDVVAEKPFDQHLPFSIPVSKFEFNSDKPFTPEQLRGNWMINWGTMWLPDTRQVSKQILLRMETWNKCTIREMKAYRAILRVKEYPSCDLDEINKVLVYQYRDGSFQTVTSSVKFDPDKEAEYLDLQTFGFQRPEIRVKYLTEKGRGPFELLGDFSEQRFYFRLPNLAKIMVVFEIREPEKPPVLFAGPLL